MARDVKQKINESLRKHACLQVVPTYLVVTKQGNLLAGKCGMSQSISLSIYV